MSSSLLTKSIRGQLVANHLTQKASSESQNEPDFIPVVKLFTPDAAATWLLTELDPSTEILFGLCDLGIGFPELGYVSLAELKSIRGALGLPVERDRYFTADKTLSAYASEASEKGRIIV